MKIMKLLILAPSYRRRTESELMPAIDRYDGVFYRVARKHLSGKDIHVLIMDDKLQLIDASEKILYSPPIGNMWKQFKISNYKANFIQQTKEKNEKKLQILCQNENIKEIFIAAGANHRKVLPDFKNFSSEVIFPRGGIGPTARALKEWIQKSC